MMFLDNAAKLLRQANGCSRFENNTYHFCFGDKNMAKVLVYQKVTKSHRLQ